eukprot:CAMPEP_0197521780 /NCGR_PEP_ID=MMETSP1318-20131121/7005_1 /TAXON_ID=552666 /ORGANISM="Partenskyella glossopodia, Strain RCC365" /LENGTH=296 /DNA_ID=CAMNT_0043073897 /DNA_START=37 /DNA_END=928 /DNA_ORIENTATION=+
MSSGGLDLHFAGEQNSSTEEYYDVRRHGDDDDNEDVSVDEDEDVNASLSEDEECQRKPREKTETETESRSKFTNIITPEQQQLFDVKIQHLTHFYEQRLDKVHKQLQVERSRNSVLNKENKKIKRKNSELKSEQKKCEAEARTLERAMRSHHEEAKRQLNKTRADLTNVKEELANTDRQLSLALRKASLEEAKRKENDRNTMSPDELLARFLSMIPRVSALNKLENILSAAEEATKAARNAYSDALKAKKNEIKESRLCRVCLDRPAERLFCRAATSYVASNVQANLMTVPCVERK